MIAKDYGFAARKGIHIHSLSYYSKTHNKLQEFICKLHKNKPTKKPFLFCRRKLLFGSSKSRKKFPAGNAGNCRWERRNAHGVCRPCRDTAASRKEKPPRAAKGFNWIARGCYLCALIRGLQNLEAFLKKVLIVAVRSCGCGVLIRGLRNLGAPRKGRRVYSFCVVQKEPKSTPEVCEPLDSGDDSKLCRKRFCKAFRRLLPKPVLPTKRRRKGFESVRKGYRSADARLMFFGKEKVYCKLTAASSIRKGLLHVSFGAV